MFLSRSQAKFPGGVVAVAFDLEGAALAPTDTDDRKRRAGDIEMFFSATTYATRLLGSWSMPAMDFGDFSTVKTGARTRGA